MNLKKKLLISSSIIGMGMINMLNAEVIGKVEKGWDKWGISGNYHTMTRSVSGDNFCAEIEMDLPVNENGTFNMPRNTWAGLYLYDSKNATRYVVVAMNDEWTASPKELKFTILSYENSGDFSMKRSAKIEKLDAKNRKCFLKIEYANKKLICSYATIPNQWKEFITINPVTNFNPDLIGLNVDAYNIETPGEVVFNQFKLVDSANKVYIEKFLDNKAEKWSRDTKAGEWMLPTPLELRWIVGAPNHSVFTKNEEPILNLQIETTKKQGETAKIDWVLKDYEGKKLVNSSTSLLLDKRFNSLSLKLPKQVLNGIYNFSVNVKIDGETEKSSYINFAIIPEREVTPNKFDETSPYAACNVVDEFNLFARLGFRKYRSGYYGFAEIDTQQEMLAKNGMLRIGCYGGFGNVAETSSSLEKQAKDITEKFLKSHKERPDLVRYFELYNEPENWPPTSRNTDLFPLILEMAAIYKDVRKGAPDVKLINPGVTHRNFSFMHKMALAAMGDAERLPDIIGVHGYRSPSAPEFGHEDDIAAMRRLFGNRPIWNNEDAYFAETTGGDIPPSIVMPGHAMIEIDEKTHAAYVVRNMLVQFAAGYELVTQYDDIASHSLSMSPSHRRPAMVTLAALTKILPHPNFQQRLTLMTDNLWAIEWKNDGEYYTTLWTLNNPEELIFANDKLEILDAFANPVKTKSLIVGGMPYYIKGKDIKFSRNVTKKLPKWPVADEQLIPHNGVTLKVGSYAKDWKNSVVWIEVSNPNQDLQIGSLTPQMMNNAPEDWKFTPAKIEYTLKPQETKRYEFIISGKTFDATKPVSGKGYDAFWWVDGYHVAIKLDGKNGSKLVPQRTPMSLRGIPYLGKDSSWDKVPIFEQMGFTKRNVELFNFWTGEADYKPTFQLAWNEKGLLLKATVIDDKHDASESGLSAWLSDSVQIGLLADREKITFTNYPVITLAGNGDVVLQRDMETRKAGAMPEVELKVNRIKGDYGQIATTIYEAVIPWSAINKNSVKQGDVIGFALLFNESDGYWRRGWETYFAQMGGQITDPRFFADITLLDEKK